MKKISIIGLGLIGGSIAKALKRNNSGYYISAYNRGTACQTALEEGVIDEILPSPENAADSDLIFICTPVELSLELFERLAPVLKENNVLTDVCSVKGAFEEKWRQLKSKARYFGGHPMTGKEKGRYDNSDPLLFENSVYIVSQNAKDDPAAKGLLDIINILGARIIFLNPFEHDKVVANVSHLPQLLSVALVNNAACNHNGINYLDFAAGGFRDMTRIASSDFGIWESILKLNKKEILVAFSSMMDELTRMKNFLDEEQFENLHKMFISSAQSREEIPKNSKGFLSPLHEILIYVKDEPGNISLIATGLSDADINIKDIELLKIREGSGGTFRLSFESADDSSKAKNILVQLGFSIV